MQYKVLINLLIPETEESFEAYIPINRTVYDVSELLADMIEAESKNISERKSLMLYDRRTGMAYEVTKLIRETNIRNGSEVVAILQDNIKEPEDSEIPKPEQKSEEKINTLKKPEIAKEMPSPQDSQTTINIDHKE